MSPPRPGTHPFFFCIIRLSACPSSLKSQGFPAASYHQTCFFSSTQYINIRRRSGAQWARQRALDAFPRHTGWTSDFRPRQLGPLLQPGNGNLRNVHDQPPDSPATPPPERGRHNEILASCPCPHPTCTRQHGPGGFPEAALLPGNLPSSDRYRASDISQESSMVAASGAGVGERVGLCLLSLACQGTQKQEFQTSQQRLNSPEHRSDCCQDYRRPALIG